MNRLRTMIRSFPIIVVLLSATSLSYLQRVRPNKVNSIFHSLHKANSKYLGGHAPVQSTSCKTSPTRLSDSQAGANTPTNPTAAARRSLVKGLTGLRTVCGASLALSGARKANAIGSLFELKDQSVVLQDISFNVENTFADGAAMKALFQDNMRTLRFSTANKTNTTVLAFGPDSYSTPKSFYPGISSYYADGGHATITLKAKRLEGNDDLVEIFERGNGLQFIKFGPDVIRISKSIEKGADVKYAYGWVDLDTPGGIPIEVVIGAVRDPLMLACIRVSNVQESVQFFRDTLGMKVLPFPLARQAGSAFEPVQPPGSVFLGYSESSMGLLLTPTPVVSAAQNTKASSGNKIAAPPLSVGNFLDAFTLVYDEKAGDLSPAFRAALASGGNGEVVSPDGYRFRLVGYEEYKKQATNQIEF